VAFAACHAHSTERCMGGLCRSHLKASLQHSMREWPVGCCYQQPPANGHTTCAPRPPGGTPSPGWVPPPARLLSIQHSCGPSNPQPCTPCVRGAGVRCSGRCMKGCGSRAGLTGLCDSDGRLCKQQLLLPLLLLLPHLTSHVAVRGGAVATAKCGQFR
jgi:hypothetical protein